jgi:hypothetical protein
MQEFISSFQRNPDGSWTCIAPATLSGPNGRIQVPPGKLIERDALYMGVDLARWLDQQTGAAYPRVSGHSA